ncbi:uncharacterized protein LOC102777139 [Neolamprologus brichardi]|uniref:uncharacterized protein LOC102777139 n=1 Tax=Neolamprologus brichardi TaxID=32507 RepID=UPI001643B51B|nr:uncharacterized protein LOC102777139 [Neolamprologus brichardi]
MKVHHTLICFFFLSLQEGNAEVTDNKNISFGVVGRNLTAGFRFLAGKWKMFCREECEGENVLINTTDEEHRRHRYSIELKPKDGAPHLSVSITQLIMPDAGQYSCAVAESPSSVSYKQFEVVVAEALLDGNDDQLKHFDKETGSSLTVGCSFNQSGNRKMFCRGECGEDEVLLQTYDEDYFEDRYRIGFRGTSEEKYKGGGILYVTITQLTESDSGRYRCLLEGSSSRSCRDFEISVTDALLDGNNPAQLKHFNKETGSSLTVGCYFKQPGRRKYFCRGECERDGILIETQGVRAQRHRYSAEYEEGSGTSGILYVTIKQLRESDSGRYRCYLDRSYSTDPYREFEITVTEASTPPSTFTGTTEQSERTASTDVVPFVGLTLALIIILLSVSVLIFCKNRSSKPKDPPVGTEHDAVTETNTVYENIRAEGRHSRSPPDSHAKYTKPSGVETSDDHSLVTAATSQHKTEDDSSKLTYSVVTFSKKSSDSANSTSCSNTSDVIYSEPRVNASHSGGDPLYSTIA